MRPHPALTVLQPLVLEVGQGLLPQIIQDNILLSIIDCFISMVLSMTLTRTTSIGQTHLSTTVHHPFLLCFTRIGIWKHKKTLKLGLVASLKEAPWQAAGGIEEACRVQLPQAHGNRLALGPCFGRYSCVFVLDLANSSDDCAARAQ